MSAVVDVLTKARALIEKPEAWTRGTLARDAAGNCVDAEANAVCWCAIGALYAVSTGLLPARANLALEQFLPGHDVARFNDDPATTHADVLAAFDRAIAAERVVS